MYSRYYADSAQLFDYKGVCQDLLFSILALTIVSYICFGVVKFLFIYLFNYSFNNGCTSLSYHVH